MTTKPQLVFATPRKLPRAKALSGRVVVLDIAFAAASSKKVTFERVTQTFIDALGDRLALWVDHHDHDKHDAYRDDPRFRLATKAEHGACPEMITPQLVASTGPVETIVCHLDFDGLYSAAKWMLQGFEPYEGADDDARVVDTRVGTTSKVGTTIDHALRGKARDDSLKHSVVHWLTSGMKKQDVHWASIQDAEQAFQPMLAATRKISCDFRQDGVVRWVDVSKVTVDYDKTELLLMGQRGNHVAAVIDKGTVTFAAPFMSGWNFIDILGLEGGMPTRVSVSTLEWQRALELVKNAAPTALP